MQPNSVRTLKYNMIIPTPAYTPKLERAGIAEKYPLKKPKKFVNELIVILDPLCSYT
jgi:hypothetical protein